MANSDEQIRIDVRQALQDIALLKGGLADLRNEAGKTRSAAQGAFSGIGTNAIKEARDIDTLKAKYREVLAATVTLRKALDNAYDPRAIKTYSEALGQAQAGLKKLEIGAKAAGVSLKDLQKEASVGKQVVGGLFSAFTVAGLVAGVGKLVAHAVQLSKNYEVARASFAAFLGDANKADEVLGKLTDFAARTPLSGEEVNAAGKALLAFGESADNLIPTLSSIGDIAKGTGKDFGELTTIYGKARTAGVLYAEDINQLVEAGVPIIQAFADQMGVSTSQVKKLASEGKIGFAQLELAFFNLTAKGGKFYNQLNNFSDTLQGKTDNLSASFDRLLLKLGNLFGPILTKGVNLLNSAIDRFNDAIDTGGGETILDRLGNAAFFLSGGLIDVAKKSQAAAKGLSDVEKSFLSGGSQTSEGFGPLATPDQRKRAALEKAANDEKIKLDAAANAKLADQRAKAAAAEAKRRKEEHDRELKEQEQFNKESNDLRLQLLDPQSEAFAITKELERFDDQLAAFQKHNLDTEQVEQQHVANMISIRLDFEAKRKKIEDDAIADLTELNKKRLELESDGKKVDFDKEVKLLETQRDIGSQRIDVEEEIGKGLIIQLKKAGADAEKVKEAERGLDASIQRKRLENEIAFQIQLRDTQDKGDTDRIASIQLTIDKLRAQLDNVKAGDTAEPGKKKSLADLLGLSKEDLQQLDQAKDAVIDILSQISQARVDDAEKALEAAKKKTEAAQAEFDKQKALDETGAADSKDSAEAALVLAQENEAKAQKIKEEAQKKQLQLDSAIQLSSLVTAAANTFKGFSEIPLVGQILAVASIAAMFASFAAARQRAAKAIKFRDGGEVDSNGVIRGHSHSDGGVSFEAEGGEFMHSNGRRLSIVNKKSTAQNFELLKAINYNDEAGKDRWALNRVATMNRDGINAAIGEGRGSVTVVTKEDRKAHSLLKQIRDKKQAQTETWVENGYRVVRKGSRTERTKLTSK